jgi:pentose-5-phosphate-3-epimerase
MNTKPSIAPKDFEDMVNKLHPAVGLNRHVEICLADGTIDHNVTWLPEGKELLPDVFNYQFNLATENWRSYIPKLFHIGVEAILVHVDSFGEKDFNDLVTLMQGKHVALGITVTNDVTISLLFEAVQFFEKVGIDVFVQVPAVNSQGLFDERAFDRIAQLRAFSPVLAIYASGPMTKDMAERTKGLTVKCLVFDFYSIAENQIEVYKELDALLR